MAAQPSKPKSNILVRNMISVRNSKRELNVLKISIIWALSYHEYIQLNSKIIFKNKFNITQNYSCSFIQKKKCIEHLLRDRDSSMNKRKISAYLELHSKGGRKTFDGNGNDTLVNYPVS